MKKPIVYVIYYSTYGHVEVMARHILQGLESVGINAKLFQIEETLSQNELDALGAPPKANDIPIIEPNDLVNADGYLFGFPTRFGSIPAQAQTFFDRCGQLWSNGTLYGKFAGTFFCTSALGGGQETTALSAIPIFTHLGIIYVPLGYKNSKLLDVSIAHGGSAWGAGRVTGNGNSIEATQIEFDIALSQAIEFACLLKRLK